MSLTPEQEKRLRSIQFHLDHSGETIIEGQLEELRRLLSQIIDCLVEL
jgi:hypothetical protein